ncbi:MAG: hypothetical protein KGZ88_01740 [Methylomicrobium sp.]|nr:hypothetical protein [Methylomicrobium sp.]PPD24118.1 MAG: hypothetical protein CTY24_01990 [Methylobacter sp.]
MSESKQSRLTRDALILEAISEIGELIERVSELEAKTVPLVHELEGKLVASIARVDNHAQQKHAEFSIVADREKKVFEANLNAAVTKTVNRMVNEVERADGLSVRSQVLIALTIAITASAISVYGSYWLFGREQAEQAAIGRAVMAVWNELDEKSKSKIEQAY